MLAVVYIVRRISSQADPEKLLEQLSHSVSAHTGIFMIVILLMPVNWLLESLKWKILVKAQLQISLKDAVKAVLAGVTTGTATPNRLGEFAGRVFMTKEGNRAELLLLTFVASFCQVGVTILAGMIAAFTGNFHWENLSENFSEYETYYLWLVPVAFAVFAVLLIRFVRKKQIRFPAVSLVTFLNVFGLSAIRYAVYVLQFVILLSMVVPELDWAIAFSGVALSYLLVTIIPTFSLTEVLVRGSVAGIVFSQTAIPADTAFYVAVLLWMINVAVPALIGSVFVFRLKFFRQEEKS